MLSKNKIKFINSIKKKKYRDIHQCFFVEGEKLVDELLLSTAKPISIYGVDSWIQKNQGLISKKKNVELIDISEDELTKISALSTPNKVLAIVNQPTYEYSILEIENKLSIFLEDINDPGNLGTIMRIADWFGIRNIFCTKNSVDVFNPKVVQSTMGAIFRIKVHYIDTEDFFKELIKLDGFPIYGTFLDGKNIYKEKLSQNGLIVMGNESHGISGYIEPYVTQKLFIPNYPSNAETSESLNISVATAISCSEFRRRM